MWRVIHYLIDQCLLNLNQKLNFPSDTFNWSLCPSLWESLGLHPMEWDLKKMLICLFKRKLQQMSTKVSEFGFGGSVWKHKHVFFSIYSFQRLLNAMCWAMKSALGKGHFCVQREHRDVKESLGTGVAVNQSSLHLQCAFLRWGRLSVLHT